MADEKIAILRLGAIGDVMHTLPLVHALHIHKPEAELIYLTDSSLLDLLDNIPGISRLLPLKLSGNPFLIFSQARVIRQKMHDLRFDLVLNLHPSWKSRFLCWLLPHNQYREYKKSKDFSKPAWINFAETYFDDLNHNTLLNQLPLLRIEDGIKALPTKPYMALVLGVGKQRAHRAWPIDRWIRLTHDLAQTYPEMRFVLIGGLDERGLSTKFMGELDPGRLDSVINLTGILSLKETACVLQNAQLTIAGDTGPLHLAAALKARTLGLFGPTSLERHFPFGGSALKATRRCDRKCSAKKCMLDREQNCMASLSTKQVLDQVQTILSV